MPDDRAALGAFLRSRRDRLSPAQAGIRAFPGPRRVPGLRREELAVLAGLSPDHYSRLEQGRQPTVSAQVLASLARALRLDDVERAHLHDLATVSSRGRSADDMPQRADPGLLRLMTAMDALPVLLLGHRGDVLARNDLLRAVLGRDLVPGSSFPRFLLQDPRARERIVNWEVFAAATVASLRRETGRRPSDRRLTALVEELRRADPAVEGWWADHDVVDLVSVRKQVVHPAAGPLDFGIEYAVGPGEPGQTLVVYTVGPGSATERVLPLLASWGAGATASAG